MRIKELQLDNFKCFRGSHRLSFDHDPGLHFITGQNNIEPNLDKNGTGKSTLLDAIFFCLYGRTLRGLKAANIHPWDESGTTKTSVDIELDNIVYRISRTWNPNSLTISKDFGDPVTVVQEDIQNLIKLSPEAFQNCVVVGQFSEMFFDLKPASKLSLFSEILDLNVWVQRSNKASDIVKGIDIEIRDLDRKLSSFDGKIEQLNVSIEEYKEKEKEFQAKKLLKSEELDKYVLQLESDLFQLQQSIKANQDYFKRLQKKDDKFNKKVRETESLRNEIDEQIRGTRDEITTIDSDIHHVEAELKKFDSVEDICPYCKQEVDSEHLESETGLLRNKLSQLTSKRDQLKKVYEEIANDSQEVKSILNNISKQRNTNKKEMDDLERNLDKQEYRIDQVTKEIKSKNSEKAKNSSEENIYSALIEQSKDKLSEINKDKKEYSKELESKQKIQYNYRYWIEGFKHVRLHIIEDALSIFEVFVNNSLIELGLVDWTVRFDVEKENKSGTISKGFQVLVKNPFVKDFIPWESWSGGEAQRLRLAGTLGLADLIEAKCGVIPNIRVFDEPSQHLSQKGITDLIDLLSSRAQKEQRQYWLVDHRSIDANFSSKLLVEKNEEGSSFHQIT